MWIYNTGSRHMSPDVTLERPGSKQSSSSASVWYWWEQLYALWQCFKRRAMVETIGDIKYARRSYIGISKLLTCQSYINVFMSIITSCNQTHHVCTSLINPHQSWFLEGHHMCGKLKHYVWNKARWRHLLLLSLRCPFLVLLGISCLRSDKLWFPAWWFWLGVSFGGLRVQKRHEALEDSKEDGVTKWQLPHTVVVEVCQELAVHVEPCDPRVNWVDGQTPASWKQSIRNLMVCYFVDQLMWSANNIGCSGNTSKCIILKLQNDVYI